MADGNPKGDYEIGYGKPPEDSRFQEGHPYYPPKTPRRKAKKKPPTARAMLAAVTSEKIVVRQNGRQRLMTRDEAALRADVKAVFSGNFSALRRIVAKAKLAGMFKDVSSEHQGGVIVIPRYRPDMPSMEEWLKAARAEMRKRNLDEPKPKRKPKPPETFEQLYRRVLSETVPLTIDGKRQRMPLLQAAIYYCSQRANAGDEKAMATLENIKKAGGYYEPQTETQKRGVIVVYEPLPKDEWLKKARETKLTINPLEGIPGAEDFIMDWKRKRGELDDDDPTGN